MKHLSSPARAKHKIGDMKVVTIFPTPKKEKTLVFSFPTSPPTNGEMPNIRKVRNSSKIKFHNKTLDVENKEDENTALA
jgi:hypothetical protein